jgi:SAM-dependent methyltransferase
MTKVQNDALTEEAWWDRYGHLHERIWNYDEKLTERVRGGYLADMEQFLFKPGGRLLEFGCGTGWVGLRVAQKGMVLEGMDLSGEQIERARENAASAGILNVHFFQGGIAQIPTGVQYDSVILHSLLHHLDQDVIKALFVHLAQALPSEGRIYAYEPAAARPGPPLGAWILDKTLLLCLRLLRFLVFHLRMQEPVVRRAIQSGWTMKSPDENPLDLNHLEAWLPDELKIVNIAYWHMCAVAYANLCMGLRPFWRSWLSRLTPVFIRLDGLVLHHPWRVYLKAWPMVGIKIQRV